MARNFRLICSSIAGAMSFHISQIIFYFWIFTIIDFKINKFNYKFSLFFLYLFLNGYFCDKINVRLSSFQAKCNPKTRALYRLNATDERLDNGMNKDKTAYIERTQKSE